MGNNLSVNVNQTVYISKDALNKLHTTSGPIMFKIGVNLSESLREGYGDHIIIIASTF